MAAVNGVSEGEKGGPPPPSPLTGCYLLIVIAEPHSKEHKDIILQRVAKGLLSWDVNDCLVDLEKELAIITEQSLEGEEARYGERLIQFASENLVTEVLIHPVVSTLAQCVRNLLSSFTRHRLIIHAGYTFAANGSWILQDGTFSLADFSEAFQEIEVQRVIRAYENGISMDIHCSPEGDWNSLPKESFARYCKVRINPNDVLTSGSPSISSFIDYISPFLLPAEIETLLESSDVVGNIRFSHPTLYVFPGGQGDAALFGINGFNMLLDGGFSRKSCFWDFVRHLDRLDAVLLTRLNNSNVNGISAVLRRKRQNAVYPQIGHFFCNIPDKKAVLSPDGDKDRDPLLINILEEGHGIIANLQHLSLSPQSCYRDSEPVNLYHKVGHGTLDMYVLSPAKDSKEVREFMQKWNNNDQKLFSYPKNNKEFVFPVQNLVSICALLVWQPANPEDNITRILYPGSTPQHKIFEGLDKIKHLGFTKHPVCSENSLTPSVSATALKAKSIIDRIAPEPKTTKRILENKQKDKISDLKTKLENKIIENGDTGEIIEKQIKKSDSTEGDKIAPKVQKPKKLDTEKEVTEKTEDKQKPKPKDEAKSKVDSKVKQRSESQQRKPKAPEKKASPTTPKKTIDSKINGETPKPKPAGKASPQATPAKSAKEASNRKVVESKYKQTARPPPKSAPEKKEVKHERKPVTRKVKETPAGKPPSSPLKKVNGAAKSDVIARKARLDKEGTTDSSTVSTPSADQESILKKDISKLTPEEIDKLKAQELADFKEEQEVVKEIEAVFRKGEVKGEKYSDMRKIKDISVEEKEKEEYLVIEKEEIVREVQEVKEDETQKLTRDSEESEKQKLPEAPTNVQKVEPKPISDDQKAAKEVTETSEEAKKVSEPVVDSKDKVLAKEESIASPEDKVDTSSERKTNDRDAEEFKEIVESQPDEKVSGNVESGATTTAPTLPEDERIPLDEIKEDNGDQAIEEKYVKEETKEKEVPVIQLPPKPFETLAKLPPVVGIRLDKHSNIRDLVKTPDEVADLPVHEEVDIHHYEEYQTAEAGKEIIHDEKFDDERNKEMGEVEIDAAVKEHELKDPKVVETLPSAMKEEKPQEESVKPEKLEPTQKEKPKQSEEIQNLPCEQKQKAADTEKEVVTTEQKEESVAEVEEKVEQPAKIAEEKVTVMNQEEVVAPPVAVETETIVVEHPKEKSAKPDEQGKIEEAAAVIPKDGLTQIKTSEQQPFEKESVIKHEERKDVLESFGSDKKLLKIEDEKPVSKPEEAKEVEKVKEVVTKNEQKEIEVKSTDQSPHEKEVVMKEEKVTPPIIAGKEKESFKTEEQLEKPVALEDEKEAEIVEFVPKDQHKHITETKMSEQLPPEEEIGITDRKKKTATADKEAIKSEEAKHTEISKDEKISEIKSIEQQMPSDKESALKHEEKVPSDITEAAKAGETIKVAKIEEAGLIGKAGEIVSKDTVEIKSSDLLTAKEEVVTKDETDASSTAVAEKDLVKKEIMKPQEVTEKVDEIKDEVKQTAEIKGQEQLPSQKEIITIDEHEKTSHAVSKEEIASKGLEAEKAEMVDHESRKQLELHDDMEKVEDDADLKTPPISSAIQKSLAVTEETEAEASKEEKTDAPKDKTEIEKSEVSTLPPPEHLETADLLKTDVLKELCTETEEEITAYGEAIAEEKDVKTGAELKKDEQLIQSVGGATGEGEESKSESPKPLQVEESFKSDEKDKAAAVQMKEAVKKEIKVEEKVAITKDAKEELLVQEKEQMGKESEKFGTEVLSSAYPAPEKGVVEDLTLTEKDKTLKEELEKVSIKELQDQAGVPPDGEIKDVTPEKAIPKEIKEAVKEPVIPKSDASAAEPEQKELGMKGIETKEEVKAEKEDLESKVSNIKDEQFAKGETPSTGAQESSLKGEFISVAEMKGEEHQLVEKLEKPEITTAEGAKVLQKSQEILLDEKDIDEKASEKEATILSKLQDETRKSEQQDIDPTTDLAKLEKEKLAETFPEVETAVGTDKKDKIEVTTVTCGSAKGQISDSDICSLIQPDISKELSTSKDEKVIKEAEKAKEEELGTFKAEPTFDPKSGILNDRSVVKEDAKQPTDVETDRKAELSNIISEDSKLVLSTASLSLVESVKEPSATELPLPVKDSKDPTLKDEKDADEASEEPSEECFHPPQDDNAKTISATVLVTETAVKKEDEKMIVKSVLEDAHKLAEVDKKLQELKSKAGDVTELPSSERRDSYSRKSIDYIEKVDLGSKSPKEREEDVAKIVATVAEVLKSDAPLEELEDKVIIPAISSFGSYTTQLRETHITTQDTPAADVTKKGEEKLEKEHELSLDSGKSITATFLDQERQAGTNEVVSDKTSSLIQDSKELMQETSKMIADIKSSKIEKSEETSLDKTESSDPKTVHRMLVTASSEDGGEETVICPVGSIIFSRSSESSGRSSPEIQSDSISTVRSAIDLRTSESEKKKVESSAEEKEKTEDAKKEILAQHEGAEKADASEKETEVVSVQVEDKKDAEIVETIVDKVLCGDGARIASEQVAGSQESMKEDKKQIKAETKEPEKPFEVSAKKEKQDIETAKIEVDAALTKTEIAIAEGKDEQVRDMSATAAEEVVLEGKSPEPIAEVPKQEKKEKGEDETKAKLLETDVATEELKTEERRSEASKEDKTHEKVIEEKPKEEVKSTPLEATKDLKAENEKLQRKPETQGTLALEAAKEIKKEETGKEKEGKDGAMDKKDADEAHVKQKTKLIEEESSNKLKDVSEDEKDSTKKEAIITEDKGSVGDIMKSPHADLTKELEKTMDSVQSVINEKVKREMTPEPSTDVAKEVYMQSEEDVNKQRNEIMSSIESVLTAKSAMKEEEMIGTENAGKADETPLLQEQHAEKGSDHTIEDGVSDISLEKEKEGTEKQAIKGEEQIIGTEKAASDVKLDQKPLLQEEQNVEKDGDHAIKHEVQDLFAEKGKISSEIQKSEGEIVSKLETDITKVTSLETKEITDQKLLLNGSVEEVHKMESVGDASKIVFKGDNEKHMESSDKGILHEKTESGSAPDTKLKEKEHASATEHIPSSDAKKSVTEAEKSKEEDLPQLSEKVKGIDTIVSEECKKVTDSKKICDEAKISFGASSPLDFSVEKGDIDAAVTAKTDEFLQKKAESELKGDDMEYVDKTITKVEEIKADAKEPMEKEKKDGTETQTTESTGQPKDSAVKLVHGKDIADKESSDQKDSKEMKKEKDKSDAEKDSKEVAKTEGSSGASLSCTLESDAVTPKIQKEDVKHTDFSLASDSSDSAGPSRRKDSITSHLSPSKTSTEDLNLSGKSTPDIADVEKLREMQEILKHEKHIPGSCTPPTVPVSPVVKDDGDHHSTVSDSTKADIKKSTDTSPLSSLKDTEVRSITPASDDYERSDISSGQASTAPNLLDAERNDSEEDVPGSPNSITSQLVHSHSTLQHEFEDSPKALGKTDPMSMSFYGSLPDEPAHKYGERFLDEADMDFEKAMHEHRQTRGEDLGHEVSSSYLFEVTQAKYGASGSSGPSSIQEEIVDAKKTESLMASSFIGELPGSQDKAQEEDPLKKWGKPLGLPSPAPPNDNKGTPKKERKLPPHVTAKNKINDDRKRAESPSKQKLKKTNAVYVDLTYVPHHGNSNYSYVDFFKRVRARYYVFSGIEPSKEVYNALLEAKQTWEDKDLEVTIIPTYDTDILGYWVAENEDLLAKHKIDLSPSASRCTINLQDHETSCSAYRLEF